MAMRATLSGLTLLLLIHSAAAQTDTRTIKTYAATGQLTVQIQDAAGAAFFEGATVTLLTNDVAEKVSMTSDTGGHAKFTSLPIGQYVMEVTAPGYRMVQEQVLVSGTKEAPSVVVSMLPKPGGAKVKIGSTSVSPQAVKQTEKALRALQFNQLEEAQQHLSRALALDPNFADGNYLMGLLLLRRKQSEKAAAYLKKSLNLAPDHASALLALGQAQYLQQDYAGASESLEKFLRERPNSPRAAVAKKYVESMRKMGRLGTTGGGAVVAVAGSLGGDQAGDLDLPPLVELTPGTETNWAPPDVDAEKVDADWGAGCELNEVVQGAANRVEELVKNVDRFTATEEIESFNLSPMGLQVSREAKKFDYLVEIRQIGKSDLDVQEYRNGSVATTQFPGHVATVGLPTLVLVFHPYYQAKYEFQCEGRASWNGNPAWVVHFQQRSDRASAMLVYHVGNRFVALGLKGRAWISAENSQILAMESDLQRPAPEIRLLRDHQLIEYGPVSFRNHPGEMWLPKSADWYGAVAGRRFHRRHMFSQFLLFSVDDKQKISTPKDADQTDSPQ